MWARLISYRDCWGYNLVGGTNLGSGSKAGAKCYCYCPKVVPPLNSFFWMQCHWLMFGRQVLVKKCWKVARFEPWTSLARQPRPFMLSNVHLSKFSGYNTKKVQGNQDGYGQMLIIKDPRQFLPYAVYGFAWWHFCFSCSMFSHGFYALKVLQTQYQSLEMRRVKQI